MLSIESSFTASLYRPYVDLGPMPDGGPFYLHGVEFAFRALAEDRDTPWLYRDISPAFRERLIETTGLTAYRLRDPRELAPTLRTERWQRLCDHLDHYAHLSPKMQFRVCRLLGKLGLYQAVLDRTPPPNPDALRQDETAADSAFLGAVAQLVLSYDGLADLNLAAFELVARHAPRGSLARIRALNQMAVLSAKHTENLAAVEHWLILHRAELEAARPFLDPAEYTFQRSYYHRAAAFVPQLRGDRRGLIDEMDRCEAYAEQMPRDTFEQRIVAGELLFATLESRIKEALLLGDFAMVEERARRLVTLIPYEPRALSYLGQALVEQQRITEALDAYLRVARRGAPEAEADWFMAGQCYEALGQPDRACDAYLAALRLDPLGIAAAERLSAVAAAVGDAVLAGWSRSHLAALRARHAAGERGKQLAAYQAYAGQLGGDGGILAGAAP